MPEILSGAKDGRYSPADMETSDKIRALYRENEDEGFKLLFEVSRTLMHSFALRIVGDKKMAEDIVQDCFVDVWANRRIPQISGDIVKYMLSAVMYTSLNYLRKNKRLDHLHKDPETILRQYAPADTEPETNPETTENLSEIAKLYENIGTLPESRRMIFILIAIEGMKYQAVAEKLGISVNTVKTQMKRAVKTLRSLFLPFTDNTHTPKQDT